MRQMKQNTAVVHFDNSDWHTSQSNSLHASSFFLGLFWLWNMVQKSHSPEYGAAFRRINDPNLG
jgi:hypothetical protein